jgi:hypothetical protein
MSPEFQQAVQLESIFLPNARARRDALYGQHGDQARFVHYTSAEAAVNIIKTKRIWMRNTTCMSDYSEVKHGFDLLNNFFSKTENTAEFSNALDSCSKNIAQEAITLFNKWWGEIKSNTFIASISEHDDMEDYHGRLSMWRAFGGSSARVAIVFKIPWVTDATEVLNVRFNPIAYLKEEEVLNEIKTVIENVRNNLEFLRGIERQIILNHVFNMLVSGVTCLKHEGFREEREWRVIYAPRMWPSKVMEKDSEIIGGIPQIIYKLPLDGSVAKELQDLDISKIFDRLIIGPTQFPLAQQEVFVDALNKAGIADADKRVFTSGIPIRI